MGVTPEEPPNPSTHPSTRVSASATAWPSEPKRAPFPAPRRYTKHMISASLGSRLVYREGLQFVESLTDAQLPSFCLSYLVNERRMREMSKEVATSEMPHAKEVSELLIRGGIRAAVEAGGAISPYDLAPP